jgi:hypothetical protein
MNTLEIHPQYKSIDFLNPIFAGLKHVLIMTSQISEQEVLNLSEAHDREI